jgi:hypothetical protein
VHLITGNDGLWPLPVIVLTAGNDLPLSIVIVLRSTIACAILASVSQLDVTPAHSVEGSDAAVVPGIAGGGVAAQTIAAGCDGR